MAFLNKVGSILKQTVSRNTNLELSASNASLFQAIRSMSSSKLFVGGLSYGTDESSLKEAFSQYGEVIEARVILDRDTGRSRGFGFISFPSSDEASTAMQAMDGQDLHGRRIRVNFATERRSGFGGGGGGGYGGGGGGGYNYGGEGGNFAGGGGYRANNYGGGGDGYGGGNSGYNYAGEGGNSVGDGGYGTNNYSGTGGYSGGNNSAGGYGNYGGGGNFGNDSTSPAVGGNYAESGGYGGGNYGNTPNTNFSGQGSNFSGGYGGGNSGNNFVGASSNDDGFTGPSYNGDQEQLSAGQGTQSVNEGFGQDISEDVYGDDDDEPKDYANTRG